MSVDASAEIHHTAIVEDGARVGRGTRIGPYCVIGPEVTIGAECELKSHVVVAGVTTMGDGNIVFPFASVGHAPQDLKYAGERTEVRIGDRNTIREYVTINPGTDGGGGLTRIGSGNLLMVSTHVGHDCHLGDGIVIANGCAIAGHVTIGDNAIIGGLSGIHQFCRIGQGAMIGGMSGIVADVIPYGITAGERAHLAGLNLIGLKRRGVAKDQINGLRAAFGDLFEGSGTLAERADRVLEGHPDNPLVADIVAFINEGSARHFTVPD